MYYSGGLEHASGQIMLLIFFKANKATASLASMLAMEIPMVHLFIQALNLLLL